MELMNMSELMAFLKVKRSTVYRLRDQGLPSIHLGRVVRFDREEVIRWLRTRQRSHTETTTTSRIDDDEDIIL